MEGRRLHLGENDDVVVVDVLYDLEAHDHTAILIRLGELAFDIYQVRDDLLWGRTLDGPLVIADQPIAAGVELELRVRLCRRAHLGRKHIEKRQAARNRLSFHGVVRLVARCELVDPVLPPFAVVRDIGHPVGHLRASLAELRDEQSPLEDKRDYGGGRRDAKDDDVRAHERTHPALVPLLPDLPGHKAILNIATETVRIGPIRALMTATCEGRWKDGKGAGRNGVGRWCIFV